jgi:hypothetical protein
MTVHRTETGLVELIATWGHGRACPISPSRPAVLTTDDGDGHLQAWRWTGKLNDALVTLANLERLKNDKVVVRYGAGYAIEPAPDGFWVETDGEMVPNTARYPEVIRW